MRFIVLLSLCFICLATHAQMKAPISGTYREKYYYLSNNNPLVTQNWEVLIDTLDAVEKRATAAGDKEFEYGIRLFKYKILYKRRISADSFEHVLKDVTASAGQEGLRYVEADALQATGDFYSESDLRQSEAIEHLVSAYNIYKHFTPDEFPPKQTYIYMLGGAFYRYEDYESCIKYMQEALRAVQSVNNNAFCSISNTIGMAYRNTGRYDSAIYYFKRTLEDARGLKNEAWMGIAQGNIGITYFHQKRYEEAIPLLEIDIHSGLTTNNIRNAMGSMAFLAAIYIDWKQYDKAEKILTDALNEGRGKSFWPNYQLEEQLYTQMARLYSAKNNYKLAYAYADSALTAKDSVSKHNNALALSKGHEKENFFKHKLEAEKLQTEVKIGLLEIGKKRIEITFTFIGIAILLVVVLFIARERKRSENLLLNILPERIAERLKKKEHPIADYFDHASILFIDMAGFTVFSDGRDPKEIVNILNHVFTCFDNIAEKYGLEKIKTIGDCYMAVSGLPDAHPNHAEAATKMALEVRAEMKGFKAIDGTPIVFRIGLDCGPVVAGVIGRRKFIYDLWGDTVNTASRMESTGVAGEIHCTDRFKKIIEHKHKFISRGETDIKGKGAMETWLIIE